MRTSGDEVPMKMHRTGLTRALISLALLWLLPQGVAAQGSTPQPAASAPSASELAKQTQNPIARLISLPLEGNWALGADSRWAPARS